MTNVHPTETNSSMSTFRHCPRHYELEYELQLEPVFEEREALDVGTCWHGAMEAKGRLMIEERAPCAVEIRANVPLSAGIAFIDTHAPSPLWREKLRRLFVAHDWYYRTDTFYTVESVEHVFEFPHQGHSYRGKTDGILRDPSGRIGINEYKTTSADISDGADYWEARRMDTQVGIYGLAMKLAEGEFAGQLPDFILYDVMKKPTIRQRKITKKELAEIETDVQEFAVAFNWYGEPIPVFSDVAGEGIDGVRATGKETIAMYGARLTADIGERPEFYFRRVPLARTSRDYDTLLEEIELQTGAIRSARDADRWPRDPDGCTGPPRGKCRFYRICEQNLHPCAGEAPPEGFRKRDHRHPELDGETENG